ncbi:MAG: LVIVD repeat-containing protein [Cyclobacteriaceae bacterium]
MKNIPNLRLTFSLMVFSLSVMIFSSCDTSDTDVSPVGEHNSGQGGSMARFAISQNHLYTVDLNSLHVYDISQPDQPVELRSVFVGVNIETIFPRGEHLFIGSQDGMYIYDISQPANPTQLSVYRHIVSCDPVVADDQYAYVTLRSVEGMCGRFTNQLDVVDISQLTAPFLVRTYPMTFPKGLGIDNKTLFVCDDGLKVFDATHADSLQLKHHFQIEANDVIPYKGTLMVIGDDGLYQYFYGDTIQLASKLPFVSVPPAL